MRTTLRACRASLLLIPAILILAGACSSKSDGGPPGSPCSEEVKQHAPICDQACKAACGCKGCTDGVPRTIDDVAYVCQGNCYVPTSGPIDSGTGGSAGGGADSGPDCENAVCDPPSICGECQNPCCCDPCVDLEQQVIDGTLYTCVGGCFSPT